MLEAGMKKQRVLSEAEQDFIKEMLPKLPPVIARKEVPRFLGGVVSSQTLSNADASGEGPEKAFRLGGKYVVYRTEALVHWLVSHYGITNIANPKTL